MSNQSIIEHKANMHYVEFREDYLAICLSCTYKKLGRSKASPYCKALILAISESWTNEKRGQGTDLTFYMTYPQWIESMYGMFGRTVVIDSLDELIGEKLLSREPFRMFGKDTYRYLLNTSEINRRIKKLDDRVPYNTRPQVNASTNKRDNQSTGLQVNGMPSTSKRVTRPQVNPNASTSGRNIESTYHHSITSTQHQGVTEDSATATSSPAQFAFQIEGWERFYYHDYCVHAGDRGINDDFTFIIKPLSDVPQDAECSICYKPVHGPHGYDDLPQLDEPYTPELSYLTSKQEAAPIVRAVEHETLLRATGNLIEKNKVISAALSEQDSYSPVTLAGGYEKKEDEDGSTDVSACRAGSTGGLPDSAPVSNQRSAQRTGRTEKAAEQPTLIVEKKPMTLDAQVDASFQVLDHVRQLATGDPMASYVRSKASRNLLKDLIKDCAGTPKEINTANLTLAWNAMWNAPRWSNGMSWQDAGKLTIKAFCNNYGEYLDIGRQAAQKQNKPANTGRTVSGMRRLGSAASAATTL